MKKSNIALFLFFFFNSSDLLINLSQTVSLKMAGKVDTSSLTQRNLGKEGIF